MVDNVKKIPVNIWKYWSHFWFDSRSDDYLYSMAVFRVIFSLTMAFYFSSRFPDIEFFYSDSGILPTLYARGMEQMAHSFSIFFYLKSLTVLYAAHAALVLALLLLAAGVFTRVISVVVYFLALMFMNRNPMATFGVDMISSFYFLYMIFSDAGARWSVDARRKKSPCDGNHCGICSISIDADSALRGLRLLRHRKTKRCSLVGRLGDVGYFDHR